MSLYNLRNPAVKRLMKEAEELLHPTEEYHAQPLEDNLFEWHFTLRGPPNTDYEGGIYHGRITLPPDYPMKPPSIILLTPNGRFETNKKICLSISGHHPESWQPSWSIRTALLAIIGFMPTHGNGAIGSLDYSPEERQQLALKSQEWQCSECGSIKEIFFKKNYCYLKDDTPLEGPEVVPENDLNQSTNEPTLLPSVKEDNKLSETSISETVHSTCVGKRAKSPFHCHGSQVVKRRYQDIIATQDVVDNPGQISAKPRSNHFYIIVVWLIVFAIAFLCVRRLFSLS